MESDKSPKDSDESDGDDSDYLAGFDLDKEVEGYLENLQSIPIELLRPKDDEKPDNITINKDKEDIESSLYDTIKSALEAKQTSIQKVNADTYEKIDSEEDDDDNLYRVTENIKQQLAKYTKEKKLPAMKEDNSNSGLEAISDNDLAGDDIESGEYYSSGEEGALNKSDPQVVDMDISDGEVDVDYNNVRDKHIKTLSITVSNTLAHDKTLNNSGKRSISKEEYERNKVVLEDYYKKCDLYMKQIMKKDKKKKKSKSSKKIKSVIGVPKSHTKSDLSTKLGVKIDKDKIKFIKERGRPSSKSPEKRHRPSYNRVKKSEHKYKLPEKINKKHKHYKKYVDYVKKEYKKKHYEHKKSLKKATKELEKQGLIGQNVMHLKKFTSTKNQKILPVLSFSDFCKSRELSPDAELQNIEIFKPENEIEILDLDSRESLNLDTEAQNVQPPAPNEDDGELFVTYSDLVKQKAFDNDPRMKGLSVFQQALFKIRPSKGIPFLQDDHQEVNEKIVTPKKFNPITTVTKTATKSECEIIIEKKSSMCQTPISFHNKALSNIIGGALNSEKETSAARSTSSTSRKLSRSTSRSPNLYRRKNSLSSHSKSRSKSPTRSRTPPRAYRKRRSRSRSRTRERKRRKSSSSPEFKHHIVYRPQRSRKRSRSRSRSRGRPKTKSRSRSRSRHLTELRSRPVTRPRSRSRSKSRSRSRTRYRYRSPKVHRSPQPEPDRRYRRRSKSPFKTFADQLRSKLKEENERALAMLRKTIDQAAVTCKNAQAAAKLPPSQESSSTKVSSGNPTQKFDKHSNLKKKFNIFKPSDLERLLPAEYSQISSCGSPSSRSETSLSPKHQTNSPLPPSQPSPKIPDISVPPPCITTAPPPPLPTTPKVGVLEEETEQIVVTTYTNYVPFVSAANPNILPSAPPGTLTPYMNPDISHYQYNNYMMPHPNLHPPHMFPPQLMGRFDQEMVLHQNVNQPRFPFINQQQFHYPMGMPQFQNAAHNPFPPNVANQPRNVSIVDISKQTITKTANIQQREISMKPQITWPQNIKKDQNLVNQLEGGLNKDQPSLDHLKGGLKKDQTFLELIKPGEKKEQSFLNQLEGGTALLDTTSNFKSMCCVHSHFKPTSNSYSKNNPNKNEIKDIINSIESKQVENKSDGIKNVSDKSKQHEDDDDCIIVNDINPEFKESGKEDEIQRINKSVTIGDLDDDPIANNSKIEKSNENTDTKIKFTLNFKPRPVKPIDLQEVENVFDNASKTVEENKMKSTENTKIGNKSVLLVRNTSNLKQNKNKEKELYDPFNTTLDDLSDIQSSDDNLSNSPLILLNCSESDQKQSLTNSSLKQESNVKNKICNENNMNTVGKSNDNGDVNNIKSNSVKEDTLKVSINEKGNVSCENENIKAKLVKELNSCENPIEEHITDKCANRNTEVGESKGIQSQNTSTKDTNNKGEYTSSQSSEIDQKNENKKTETIDKKNINKINTSKDEIEIFEIKNQTESTDGKLFEFPKINSNDSVSQIKLITVDANPSYKKKINLENKINKLLQVLSSSTSSSEDSKTEINDLVDNILAEEQSKNIMKKSNTKLNNGNSENCQNLNGKSEIERSELQKETNEGSTSLNVNESENNQSIEKEFTKEITSKNSVRTKSKAKEENPSKDVKANLPITTNKTTIDVKNKSNDLKNKTNTNNDVSRLEENPLNENTNENKNKRAKYVRKSKGNILIQNNEALKVNCQSTVSVEKEIEASLTSQLKNKSEDNLILSDLEKGQPKKKIKGLDMSVETDELTILKDTNNSTIQISDDESSTVTRRTRGRNSRGRTEKDIDENSRRPCKTKVESVPKSSSRLLRNNINRKIDANEEIPINNVDIETQNEPKTIKRGRRKKVNEFSQNHNNETGSTKLEESTLDSAEVNVLEQEPIDSTKNKSSLPRNELKKVSLSNSITNSSEDYSLDEDKKKIPQKLDAKAVDQDIDIVFESAECISQNETRNKDFDSEPTIINIDTKRCAKNKREKTVKPIVNKGNKTKPLNLNITGVQYPSVNDSALKESIVINLEHNIGNKSGKSSDILVDEEDDDVPLTKYTKKTKGGRKIKVDRVKTKSSNKLATIQKIKTLNLYIDGKTEDNLSKECSENSITTIKINNYREDLFQTNLNKLSKSEALQNAFYLPKDSVGNSTKCNFDLPAEKPCPLSKKSLYYITQNFLAQRAAEEEEHQSVVKGLKLKTLQLKLTRIDGTQNLCSPKITQTSKKICKQSAERNKRKVSGIRNIKNILTVHNISDIKTYTDNTLSEAALIEHSECNQGEDFQLMFDESEEHLDTNAVSDIVICDVFSMSDRQMTSEMLSQDVELDDSSELKTHDFLLPQIEDTSIKDSGLKIIEIVDLSTTVATKISNNNLSDKVSSVLSNVCGKGKGPRKTANKKKQAKLEKSLNETGVKENGCNDTSQCDGNVLKPNIDNNKIPAMIPFETVNNSVNNKAHSNCNAFRVKPKDHKEKNIDYDLLNICNTDDFLLDQDEGDDMSIQNSCVKIIETLDMCSSTSAKIINNEAEKIISPVLSNEKVDNLSISILNNLSLKKLPKDKALIDFSVDNSSGCHNSVQKGNIKDSKTLVSVICKTLTNSTHEEHFNDDASSLKSKVDFSKVDNESLINSNTANKSNSNDCSKKELAEYCTKEVNKDKMLSNFNEANSVEINENHKDKENSEISIVSVVNVVSSNKVEKSEQNKTSSNSKGNSVTVDADQQINCDMNILKTNENISRDKVTSEIMLQTKEKKNLADNESTSNHIIGDVKEISLIPSTKREENIFIKNTDENSLLDKRQRKNICDNHRSVLNILKSFRELPQPVKTDKKTTSLEILENDTVINVVSLNVFLKVIERQGKVKLNRIGADSNTSMEESPTVYISPVELCGETVGGTSSENKLEEQVQNEIDEHGINSSEIEHMKDETEKNNDDLKTSDNVQRSICSERTASVGETSTNMNNLCNLSKSTTEGEIADNDSQTSFNPNDKENNVMEMFDFEIPAFILKKKRGRKKKCLNIGENEVATNQIIVSSSNLTSKDKMTNIQNKTDNELSNCSTLEIQSVDLQKSSSVDNTILSNQLCNENDTLTPEIYHVNHTDKETNAEDTICNKMPDITMKKKRGRRKKSASNEDNKTNTNMFPLLSTTSTPKGCTKNVDNIIDSVVSNSCSSFEMQSFDLQKKMLSDLTDTKALNEFSDGNDIKLTLVKDQVNPTVKEKNAEENPILTTQNKRGRKRKSLNNVNQLPTLPRTLTSKDKLQNHQNKTQVRGSELRSSSTLKIQSLDLQKEEFSSSNNDIEALNQLSNKNDKQLPRIDSADDFKSVMSDSYSSTKLLDCEPINSTENTLILDMNTKHKKARGRPKKIKSGKDVSTLYAVENESSISYDNTKRIKTYSIDHSKNNIANEKIIGQEKSNNIIDPLTNVTDQDHTISPILDQQMSIVESCNKMDQKKNIVEKYAQDENKSDCKKDDTNSMVNKIYSIEQNRHGAEKDYTEKHDGVKKDYVVEMEKDTNMVIQKESTEVPKLDYCKIESVTSLKRKRGRPKKSSILPEAEISNITKKLNLRTRSSSPKSLILSSVKVRRGRSLQNTLQKQDVLPSEENLSKVHTSVLSDDTWDSSNHYSDFDFRNDFSDSESQSSCMTSKVETKLVNTKLPSNVKNEQYRNKSINLIKSIEADNCFSFGMEFEELLQSEPLTGFGVFSKQTVSPQTNLVKSNTSNNLTTILPKKRGRPFKRRIYNDDSLESSTPDITNMTEADKSAQSSSSNLKQNIKDSSKNIQLAVKSKLRSGQSNTADLELGKPTDDENICKQTDLHINLIEKEKLENLNLVDSLGIEMEEAEPIENLLTDTLRDENLDNSQDASKNEKVASVREITKTTGTYDEIIELVVNPPKSRKLKKPKTSKDFPNTLLNLTTLQMDKNVGLTDSPIGPTISQTLLLNPVVENSGDSLKKTKTSKSSNTPHEDSLPETVGLSSNKKSDDFYSLSKIKIDPAKKFADMENISKDNNKEKSKVSLETFPAESKSCVDKTETEITNLNVVASKKLDKLKKNKVRGKSSKNSKVTRQSYALRGQQTSSLESSQLVKDLLDSWTETDSDAVDSTPINLLSETEKEDTEMNLPNQQTSTKLKEHPGSGDKCEIDEPCNELNTSGIPVLEKPTRKSLRDSLSAVKRKPSTLRSVQKSQETSLKEDEVKHIEMSEIGPSRFCNNRSDQDPNLIQLETIQQLGEEKYPSNDSSPVRRTRSGQVSKSISRDNSPNVCKGPNKSKNSQEIPKVELLVNSSSVSSNYGTNSITEPRIIETKDTSPKASFLINVLPDGSVNQDIITRKESKNISGNDLQTDNSDNIPTRATRSSKLTLSQNSDNISSVSTKCFHKKRKDFKNTQSGINDSLQSDCTESETTSGDPIIDKEPVYTDSGMTSGNSIVDKEQICLENGITFKGPITDKEPVSSTPITKLHSTQIKITDAVKGDTSVSDILISHEMDQTLCKRKKTRRKGDDLSTWGHFKFIDNEDNENQSSSDLPKKDKTALESSIENPALSLHDNKLNSSNRSRSSTPNKRTRNRTMFTDVGDVSLIDIQPTNSEDKSNLTGKQNLVDKSVSDNDIVDEHKNTPLDKSNVVKKQLKKSKKGITNYENLNNHGSLDDKAIKDILDAECFDTEPRKELPNVGENLLEVQTPLISKSTTDNTVFDHRLPISLEDNMPVGKKNKEIKSANKQKNNLNKSRKRTQDIFKAECSIKLDSFPNFSEIRTKYKDLQAKVQKMNAVISRSTIESNDDDSNNLYDTMDTDDVTSSDRFSEESYICTSKMSLTENKILLVKQVKPKRTDSIDVNNETRGDILSSVSKSQTKVSDTGFGLQKRSSPVLFHHEQTEGTSLKGDYCDSTETYVTESGEKNGTIQSDKGSDKNKSLNSPIEIEVEKSEKLDSIKTRKHVRLKHESANDNKFDPPMKVKKIFNDNSHSTKIDNAIEVDTIEQKSLTSKVNKTEQIDLSGEKKSVIPPFGMKAQRKRRSVIELTLAHNTLEPVDGRKTRTSRSCIKKTDVNIEHKILSSSEATSEVSFLQNVTSTVENITSNSEVTEQSSEVKLWNKISGFLNMESRTVCTQVELSSDALHGAESVESVSKVDKIGLDNVLDALTKLKQCT